MIYPFDEKGKMTWGLAPMVDIPEGEQENYPIPGQEGKFYETRLDVEGALTYDKKEFVQACYDMGIIKEVYKNPDGTTAIEVEENTDA